MQLRKARVIPNIKLGLKKMPLLIHISKIRMISTGLFQSKDVDQACQLPHYYTKQIQSSGAIFNYCSSLNTDIAANDNDYFCRLDQGLSNLAWSVRLAFTQLLNYSVTVCMQSVLLNSSGCLVWFLEVPLRLLCKCLLLSPWLFQRQ